MKRKLLNTILCFTICSSAFAGLFSGIQMKTFAVSQETQDAIDEAEKEKEQLENELQQQEEEKEQLETNKETQEQKLKKLKQEYRTLSSDLDSLNEEKIEKENEIQKKEKELEIAIQMQKEQYKDMKKRIQYMYEKQEESLLGLFFKRISFAEILNRVDENKQIQEYDRTQLEEYKETAKEIEKQREELQKAQKDLESLIAETEKQQVQIGVLQQQTSNSILEYLNQIENAEEEIGNTEEALKAKADALLELYAKAQAEEDSQRAHQAEEAAKRLQEALANGTLKVDDAGIIRGSLELTQAEMEMLTAMIYCESRGEPYEGQLAVGHVIMNRVRSSKFPNSLEAVLRANKQFEPAGSGRFDIVLTAYREEIPGVIGQAEWESCEKAAGACVNGESNVGDCLFFRTHKPVPQLAENLELAGVPYWIIKNHIFYYSWVNY